MTPTRRDFLTLMASGAAAPLVNLRPHTPTSSSRAASSRPAKAVLFDAFPIFDPRPVFALAEALCPGQGAELSALWRTRQFEYTWLRIASGQYRDFWKVTGDALDFAAQSLKIELGDARRTRLMQAYLALDVYPDVRPALRALKDAGVRLAFLSNLTPAMLDAGITRASLGTFFDAVISTDAAHTYKPDPRAYQLGLDALKLSREDCVFAAFAGWDAAGAKWFGYRTFWVNRLNQTAEELGVTSDGASAKLDDLVTFATATATGAATGAAAAATATAAAAVRSE